jgi:LPPG:FO 2-phospho-L-lactate transferase
LAAVILCPSNPYLSIDPILSLPAIRALLRDCAAPVVAVSPIVGGRAIKGPTAKIMAELGIAPTSASIVAHYSDFLDGIILDETDRDEAASLPIPALVTGTVMATDDDRVRLAREAIGFATALAKRERR